MFYLLTKRVVKVARSAGADRFAARSTNTTSWTVSGPFPKRPLADRAAVSALGTHTCLAAQVVTTEQLTALANGGSQQTDYDLDHAVRHARKWLMPAAAQ